MTMPNNYFERYQNHFEHFIDEALKEDIGSEDHSSLSCIEEASKSNAVLLVKEVGIIAGMQLAKHIFKQYDPALVLPLSLKMVLGLSSEIKHLL